MIYPHVGSCIKTLQVCIGYRIHFQIVNERMKIGRSYKKNPSQNFKFPHEIPVLKTHRLDVRKTEAYHVPIAENVEKCCRMRIGCGCDLCERDKNLSRHCTSSLKRLCRFFVCSSVQTTSALLYTIRDQQSRLI